MPNIHQNIEQKLLKIVLFATLLISLITGTAIFFYEREALEDKAIQITDTLIHKTFENGHVQGLIQNKQQLKAFLNKTVKGQFKYIEIYDKKGRSLAESISTDDSVPTILQNYQEDKNNHDINRATRYRTYYIGDDMYVQIFVNISYGHAEVIYEIPEYIYQLMQQSIMHSIIIAILAVLFTAMILYPLVKQLVNSIQQNEQEILQSNVDMLSLIGAAIAKRDSDTDEHNFRVTLYALKLAEALKLPKTDCQELIKGAFVHDIGKIAIPDAILLKPGKLDEAEFEIMKSHVSEGADIVREVKWLESAQNVVHYHHEKYDGTGYLTGLKGEEIPLSARIFTIVDVFDALNSNRPYKKAFTLEETIHILEEGIGSHFDPKLIQIFLPMTPDLLTRYGSIERPALRLELIKEVQHYFKA